MPDASYDVVYAGGGHHALMSAPYFSMNNMSVGVFEASHEIGGGADSQPRPLPGFVGNPHFHMIVTHQAPQVQDFKLWETGLKFNFPEREGEMVFPDGSAFSLFHCTEYDIKTGGITFIPELYEKNCEVFAKISRKDADRMIKLYDKCERYWLLAVMQHFFNPPFPPGEDPIEELIANSKESYVEPRWQYMPYVEYLKELFESPKFQMILFRESQASGSYPNDIYPLPFALYMFLLTFGVLGTPHVEGGSHQVAHACQRRLALLGGKTFTGCEIDKLIIENGKCKGIKLVDGTEIEAKKFVVVNMDPFQLIFRLLRDYPISDDIKMKLKAIKGDRANIFWGNIAYHERPNWIGEAGADPGFGGSSWTFCGDDDMEYIAYEYQYRCQHIRPGNWPPKLYFYESSPTAFGVDPTVAPPGKHTTLLEEYGPGTSAMSEREWIQVRREFPTRILQEWAKYAPNMAPDSDNIIGVEVDTPWDCLHRHKNYFEGSWVSGVGTSAHQWGRYRPIPELAHYQVPGIDNLYLCGLAYHSCGWSFGSTGYNMYKMIQEKYNLRKFWDEAGRIF